MIFPQPHTVTIETAVPSTDARGDETHTFTSATTVRGWMQQTPRPPVESLGDRDVRTSKFTLFSTQTPDMTALDRVVWDGKTFVCDGQPNHLTTPRGYHHTEANLELVEG